MLTAIACEIVSTQWRDKTKKSLTKYNLVHSHSEKTQFILLVFQSLLTRPSFSDYCMRYYIFVTSAVTFTVFNNLIIFSQQQNTAVITVTLFIACFYLLCKINRYFLVIFHEISWYQKIDSCTILLQNPSFSDGYLLHLNVNNSGTSRPPAGRSICTTVLLLHKNTQEYGSIFVQVWFLSTQSHT